MQIEEIEPNERRQHERRVLRGLSQLQFGKNPAMETRTMDVSISGLGIIAPVNPPSRTQCTIRVVVPIDVYTRADDGFKVGLMFVNMPAESTAVLGRFIKR